MGHRKHTQGLTAKHPKEGESLGRRHHNFNVELFLDEMGQPSDIFIDHGQSGEKEQLTSWEPEKLIGFIARHTGLQSTHLAFEEPTSQRKQASRATTTDPLIETSPTPGYTPPSTVSADLAGTPRLRDLKVVLVDSDNPNFVLHQGQPFIVRLTLDLTEVIASRKVPLVYEATIVAREPGGHDQSVGEARKKIEASKNTTISVACTGLPPGMYRLEALVRLALAGAEHGHKTGAVAYLEGDLLEVC